MTVDASTYQPDVVEAKWRARWAERGTNQPDLDNPIAPFYNLMMFPYPSAEGLHVGNLFAFTGADVFGRFKRMRGFDVFQPMGFDAFGLALGLFDDVVVHHRGVLHELHRSV